jgi:VanZ family protein
VWSWSRSARRGPRQAVAGRPGLDSAAPRSARARARSALLASLLLILLVTLTPGQWSETKGRPQGRDLGIADILLNMALFAPLGAVLGHRGRSASGTLFLGAMLSGAIEIAQLGVPGRVASFDDVLSDTVGTIAGWVLQRTAPVWVRPDPKVAGWLSLAAASMASAVLGVTGLLLQPSFPPTKYFGGWMHEFGHLRVYHGQVLEASLGGAGIPPGPIPHSPELRSRLAAGEALRVRAVAGPPVAGLAPILSIHDEYRHEILLLGPDREDLVYRFRTRAAAVGFDSPELRVSGAMRGIRAGEPLVIVVAPERNGYCIEANRTATCGLGFTAGTGWALLLYGPGLPPWTHGFLNVLWMAGLVLPMGYWARARWECGVAIALLAGAALLLPVATGLVPTPLGELAAAIAGLLGGVGLQFRLGRWGLRPLSGQR